MRKRTPPSYQVPALEKGLNALEALAAAKAPQSLTELARTLNRTSSELFRMITVLERRGYIARDPLADGYHLTLKLYELAHTHSPVDQLLKAAALPMQRLAESIEESCHLCVLNGPRLTVIAQAESPEPVRLSVEVGYQAQPLTTVSGRLLVAFLNREEQETFLKADPFYRKLSARRRQSVREELEKIRHDGAHMASSSRRTGIDVSCLVGNPQTGPLAALGVPFIAGGANEGKERRLIGVIQQHANRITRSLGLSRPGA
jgi:DNA-binding IclR family transcriptional regulator